jgi:protein-S-isoprenylcysteine O-methyltransferase Ste14
MLLCRLISSQEGIFGQKYYTVVTTQTAEKSEMTASSEVEADRKAYYAKTAILLILVILLAFNMSFPLGFSISFAAYATLMLIFFGVNRSTAIFSIAAFVTLVTYFIPVKVRLRSSGR